MYIVEVDVLSIILLCGISSYITCSCYHQWTKLRGAVPDDKTLSLCKQLVLGAGLLWKEKEYPEIGALIMKTVDHILPYEILQSHIGFDYRLMQNELLTTISNPNAYLGKTGRNIQR